MSNPCNGSICRIPGSRRQIAVAVVVFSIAFVTLPLSAQTISRAGTTAAPFLKIGVGARALAMGEAYSTQAEDVTALYWNPAGLAWATGMQILLNHYDYLADIYYEYGGLSIPFPGIGTLGLYFSYMGMPDLERTTLDYPDGNGEMVSASSYAIGLCFARALNDRFSIGGGIKYVRETIWHSHAAGVAFDVGLIYHTFFKNLRIGMSISNFGSDMQMNGSDMLVQHDIDPTFAGNNENINSYLATDQFPLPLLFRVGLSANVTRDFFHLDHYDWIVSVDAVHPNDNREYLNVGTEVRLYNLIALRGGYRALFLEEREGGLTLGAGVQVHVVGLRMMLDYAYVDYGRLDQTNKFSFILSF